MMEKLSKLNSFVIIKQNNYLNKSIRREREKEGEGEEEKKRERERKRKRVG